MIKFGDNHIIIGAGIGGLTVALALQKRGINCKVYEKAKIFGPVGAGIVLGNNAMTILDNLGVAEKIHRYGIPIDNISYKNYRGSFIKNINLKQLSTTLGSASVAIHRSDLHNILHEKLYENTVSLGQEFIKYTHYDNGIKAHFRGGLVVDGSLLIGSDGINSKTKDVILGKNQLRNCNMVCYRGVCEMQGELWDNNDLNEFLGDAMKFGFVSIGARKKYWYSTIRTDLNPKTQSLPDKQFLIRAIQNWPEHLIKLVQDTDDSNLITNFLFDDTPKHKWHDQRAVLLGDAIHPTTPFMGQGAAMAIESAEVLAYCLERYENYNNAITNYEKLRMTRTSNITNKSLMFGQFMVCPPAATKIRNLVLKYTPNFISNYQSKKIYDYDIYQ